MHLFAIKLNLFGTHSERKDNFHIGSERKTEMTTRRQQVAAETAKVEGFGMPPKFEGDEDEYLNWMADLESWLVCTHIEKANQALAIRMRLGGPPKDIANELDAGDLRVPEEVDGTGVGLRIGGIPKGVFVLIEAINQAGYRGDRQIVASKDWEAFITFKRGDLTMRAFTQKFKSARAKVEREPPPS